MKMSYLAGLCGLPRTASEDQIQTELERMATLANVAGEGGGYSQVSGLGRTIGAGTNDYSTRRLSADTAGDVSRTGSEAYIVRSVRPGHWQVFARQPDGSYKPYGVESIALNTLEKQVDALNLQARTKSSRANEVMSLVNECMEKRGLNYSDAFCQIRKTRSDLFAGMVDPAPSQKAAHTPRRK